MICWQFLSFATWLMGLQLTSGLAALVMPFLVISEWVVLTTFQQACCSVGLEMLMLVAGVCCEEVVC